MINHPLTLLGLSLQQSFQDWSTNLTQDWLTDISLEDLSQPLTDAEASLAQIHQLELWFTELEQWLTAGLEAPTFEEIAIAPPSALSPLVETHQPHLAEETPANDTSLQQKQKREVEPSSKVEQPTQPSELPTSKAIASTPSSNDRPNSLLSPFSTDHLLDLKETAIANSNSSSEASETLNHHIQQRYLDSERGAGVPPLAGGAAPTSPVHQKFVNAIARKLPEEKNTVSSQTYTPSRDLNLQDSDLKVLNEQGRSLSCPQFIQLQSATIETDDKAEQQKLTLSSKKTAPLVEPSLTQEKKNSPEQTPNKPVKGLKELAQILKNNRSSQFLSTEDEPSQEMSQMISGEAIAQSKTIPSFSDQLTSDQLSQFNPVQTQSFSPPQNQVSSSPHEIAVQQNHSPPFSLEKTPAQTPSPDFSEPDLDNILEAVQRQINREYRRFYGS